MARQSGASKRVDISIVLLLLRILLQGLRQGLHGHAKCCGGELHTPIGATLRLKKPKRSNATATGSVNDNPSRWTAISLAPTRSTSKDSMTVRGVVKSMRQASGAMRRCSCHGADCANPANPTRMNAGFAAAAMALHTQLGVELFERTGRGLVPTAIALQLA